MSEPEGALIVRARGEAEFETATETDAMRVGRTAVESIDAEIDLDADRLADSDIAHTYRAGVTITASDVAEHVCAELDAKPLDPQNWDITVSGRLDDWQTVVLRAAKQRRTHKSQRVETAIEVLLTMHERYATTDRPLLAALNIDETYDACRRDELLDALTDTPSPADDAAEVSA